MAAMEKNGENIATVLKDPYGMSVGLLAGSLLVLADLVDVRPMMVSSHVV